MALYIYIYIRLKTGDSRLINGLSNKTKRCTCTYTISGQKYSDKRIFYYIFHLNVLSLYCIFDVQNLVLCLNREIIKIIDYKFMLKLQCKTTFNSAFCY
jgi:hypothetical protein